MNNNELDIKTVSWELSKVADSSILLPTTRQSVNDAALFLNTVRLMVDAEPSESVHNVLERVRKALGQG